MSSISIKLLPLNILKKTRGNPNVVTDDVHRGMVESMKRKGWLLDAPVVRLLEDGDYRIISGHHRVAAGIEAGIIETYCKVIEGITDEQAAILTIEANKRRGELDDKLLNSFIDGIVAEHKTDLDFLYQETGLDIDNILNAEKETANDDEIPEAAPATTKQGDLWELGHHRLLCGDNADITNVSKLMGGNQAFLCFTDPPYSVGYDVSHLTGHGFKSKRRKFNPVFDGVDGYKEAADAFKVLDEFMATLPCQTIIISYSGSHLHDYVRVMDKYKFETINVLIWNKSSFSFWAGARYQQKHELIFLARKKGAKFYSDTKTNDTTVLDFKKASRNKIHPTVRPLELYVFLLSRHARKNDIIYDPFIGGGTSLIASEKLGLICYGMEISGQFCDIIVKRYEDWCIANNKVPEVKLNGTAYYAEAKT